MCKKTVKTFNNLMTIFNPKEDIVERIGFFNLVFSFDIKKKNLG